MWFFLLFLILIPRIPFENLVELTHFLHDWCLKRVSTYAENKEIQSALICGKTLPLGPSRNLFTQAGMIHLMVVSGAHLMFLEKSLSIIPHWRYKRFLIIVLLTFYSFCTQMNPPILRALISVFLKEFSKKFQLHWDSFYRLIISGIACLTLNPQWIASASLQLSLVGTLAFSYSRQSKLIAHILCFIFIVPLVSQWSVLHPLSILLNWILFPLFSAVIFPLSILSFIFPFLYPFTQFLMDQFILILTYLQPFLQYVPFVLKPIPFSIRWIYIAVLFFIFKYLTQINQKARFIL